MSLNVLIIMVTVVVIGMRTGWKISRLEGSALVVINLVRWITNFSK